MSIANNQIIKKEQSDILKILGLSLFKRGILMFGYRKEVDKIMISKGYAQKSWISRVFEGDEHSELSWQKRIHIPAYFLLTV